MSSTLKKPRKAASHRKHYTAEHTLLEKDYKVIFKIVPASEHEWSKKGDFFQKFSLFDNNLSTTTGSESSL